MIYVRNGASRIAVLSIVLSGSTAFAGIGDAMTDKVYTVPGVVHTSSLATVFHCTNSYPTGYGSVSMHVEVWDSDGQLAGSATFNLAGGASGIITTGTISALIADANANVADGTQGSASIAGDKRLLCTAYVTSRNATPEYMNSLPVIVKNKQRGD